MSKNLNQVLTFIILVIGLSYIIFWGPIALLKLRTANLVEGKIYNIPAFIFFLIGGFVPSFVGIILTFIYDVGSSLGFALAYPAFTNPLEAIYLTFIPLYYPWPPIIHTFTNAIIFGLIAPVIIRAITQLPETLNIRNSK